VAVVFSLFAYSVPSWAQPSVSAPSARGVNSGDFVTLVFNVTNTGGAPATYDLTTASSAGLQVISALSPLTLGAGASDTVFVSVSVAFSALVGPGTVSLTATDQVNPALNDSASVTLDVLPVSRVEVSPPLGKTARPGDVVDYDFVVTNRGNGIDHFNLSAASQSGFSITLPTPQVGLVPGESVTVQLSLSVPVTAQQQRDVLTFRATSQQDPNMFAQTQVTTTLLPPGFERVSTGLGLSIPASVSVSLGVDPVASTTTASLSFRTGGQLSAAQHLALAFSIADLIKAPLKIRPINVVLSSQKRGAFGAPSGFVGFSGDLVTLSFIENPSFDVNLGLGQTQQSFKVDFKRSPALIGVILNNSTVNADRRLGLGVLLTLPNQLNLSAGAACSFPTARGRCGWAWPSAWTTCS